MEHTQLMSTNKLTEVASLLVAISCYSIAPLRKEKASVITTKKTDKRQIDWNYFSTLNHLYLHRHIPLELFKLAAYRNLIRN